MLCVVQFTIFTFMKKVIHIFRRGVRFEVARRIGRYTFKALKSEWGVKFKCWGLIIMLERRV